MCACMPEMASGLSVDGCEEPCALVETELTTSGRAAADPSLQPASRFLMKV